MKHTILAILAGGMLLTSGMNAQAVFPDDIRQAWQAVGADVQASLARSGISGSKTISVLPIDGDQGHYIEGLIKNAVTDAGLMYVEGKDDPFWNQVLAEVEWDERKGDMLDPTTITRFGKLKSSQYLIYGSVRAAEQTRNRVFVELELHMSSIETKQHVWGGVFAQRYYMPGTVSGIIDLDSAVKQTLKTTMNNGIASLNDSKSRLNSLRSIAIVPLAGDIDGYITGLTQDMLTKAGYTPKNLDISTLGEARQILRDRPEQADAVLYGAVRDLSRELDRQDLGKDTYNIFAEVQLRIESAPDGDVLWSDTLFTESETTEELTHWEMWKDLQAKYPHLLLWLGGGIVAIIVLSMFLRATRRVR